MAEELVGYHGTKKENIKSICQNNFNLNEDISNKRFLGAGVYFFYNCEDALDWNIKSFKQEFLYLPGWKMLSSKYSIIESEIYVNQEEMLDLDKKENLYKLELLVEKVKGKLITKPEYNRANNKTAAIINMLYQRKCIKKKVLIKTFTETIDVKNLDSLKNYPRKMFCVKDIDIIKHNIEKLDINEEMFNSIVYFYK